MDELFTSNAVEARNLAKFLNDELKAFVLEPGGYSPELSAPAGPSTGGGQQALQHLRLLPKDTSMPTLLAGTANKSDSTAELYTYAYMDEVYRARFQMPFPLARPAYEDFLTAVRGLLTVMQFTPTLRGPTGPTGALAAAKMSAAPPPKPQRTWLVAVACLFGGAIVVEVVHRLLAR